jgi:hypothetical protein
LHSPARRRRRIRQAGKIAEVNLDIVGGTDFTKVQDQITVRVGIVDGLGLGGQAGKADCQCAQVPQFFQVHNSVVFSLAWLQPSGHKHRLSITEELPVNRSALTSFSGLNWSLP